MRRHTRSAALAAPLLLLLLALGACGGDSGGAGDPTGGGPVAGSDHDKQLAFAKCMRDNGVDMPDPEIGAGGTSVGAAADAQNPAFKQAFEKCRSKLPNGGQPQPFSPEQREEQMAFAKCMRENGIADYPDPPADGAPRKAPALPEPDEPGYEAATAAFQKASEKCGLPAGVVPGKPAR